MVEQEHHEADGSSGWRSKRRRFPEGPVPDETGDAEQIPRGDRARVRGRRGHLKLMTEMPFDILLEIFGQLDPIDLLHLSWSTKTLRDIIMSKSGRILWKNVL